MAKNPPAYQYYPSDFDTATRGWTLSEVGLYQRLLNHQWINGSLPGSLKRLERIAGATPKEFSKCWKIVSSKFEECDDGFLRNPTMEERRRKTNKYRQLQAERGRKGGKARAEALAKPAPKRGLSQRLDRDPSRDQALQSSSSTSTTTDTPPPTPLPTSQEEGLSPTGSAPPACPHQEIIGVYHETLPSLQRVQSWEGKRPGYLRARWREKAERQKIEYWREFFEYVKLSDFLMGRVESRNGSGPFRCSLEWLVRSTNFQNVVEGKYHDQSGPGGGSGRYQKLN